MFPPVAPGRTHSTNMDSPPPAPPIPAFPLKGGKGNDMEQTFIKINTIRNKPFSAGAREKAMG